MGKSMGDPKGIAGQFLQHYYGIFEGAELAGQAAIIGKLTNLSFQTVKHDLGTARLDVLVTNNQGLYILVTGVLSADGAPPMAFCETFILHQQPGGGSWYIHNHIFR